MIAQARPDRYVTPSPCPGPRTGRRSATAVLGYRFDGAQGRAVQYRLNTSICREHSSEETSSPPSKPPVRKSARRCTAPLPARRPPLPAPRQSRPEVPLFVDGPGVVPEGVPEGVPGRRSRRRAFPQVKAHLSIPAFLVGTESLPRGQPSPQAVYGITEPGAALRTRSAAASAPTAFSPSPPSPAAPTRSPLRSTAAEVPRGDVTTMHRNRAHAGHHRSSPRVPLTVALPDRRHLPDRPAVRCRCRCER